VSGQGEVRQGERVWVWVFGVGWGVGVDTVVATSNC
jgi:hypothetical protein